MKRSEQGFTLLELLVVMTIIGILASIAIPALRDSPQRAREAALREDLFTLRSTIDSYHGDKGYYPPDLATLVTDGYMRQVPEDPFTKSKDSWTTDPAPSDPSNPTAEPGVYNVHSGSDATAIDGSKYAEW